MALHPIIFIGIFAKAGGGLAPVDVEGESYVTPTIGDKEWPSSPLLYVSLCMRSRYRRNSGREVKRSLGKRRRIIYVCQWVSLMNG